MYSVLVFLNSTVQVRPKGEKGTRVHQPNLFQTETFLLKEPSCWIQQVTVRIPLHSLKLFNIKCIKL